MDIFTLLGNGEWQGLEDVDISMLLVTVIYVKTEIESDSEYRKLKDSTKKYVCKVYRN